MYKTLLYIGGVLGALPSLRGSIGRQMCVGVKVPTGDTTCPLSFPQCHLLGGWLVQATDVWCREENVYGNWRDVKQVWRCIRGVSKPKPILQWAAPRSFNLLLFSWVQRPFLRLGFLVNSNKSASSNVIHLWYICSAIERRCSYEFRVINEAFSDNNLVPVADFISSIDVTGFFFLESGVATNRDLEIRRWILAV